jgi:hypothetical protein
VQVFFVICTVMRCKFILTCSMCLTMPSWNSSFYHLCKIFLASVDVVINRPE